MWALRFRVLDEPRFTTWQEPRAVLSPRPSSAPPAEQRAELPPPRIPGRWDLRRVQLLGCLFLFPSCSVHAMCFWGQRDVVFFTPSWVAGMFCPLGASWQRRRVRNLPAFHRSAQRPRFPRQRVLAARAGTSRWCREVKSKAGQGGTGSCGTSQGSGLAAGVAEPCLASGWRDGRREGSFQGGLLWEQLEPDAFPICKSDGLFTSQVSAGRCGGAGVPRKGEFVPLPSQEDPQGPQAGRPLTAAQQQGGGGGGLAAEQVRGQRGACYCSAGFGQTRCYR